MVETITVTCGSAMYFLNFSVSETANCCGVRPAACTSFSNGKEILPSGRTGKVAVKSASFHTATCSTSSGPITYVASTWLGGTAASGLEGDDDTGDDDDDDGIFS